MDSMIIHNRLINEIQRRGYSKNKLCEEADISHSTFYNWKKKQIFPSLNILNRMCEALDLELSTLFVSELEYDSLLIEEKQIIEKYHLMNEHQRLLIKELINELTKEGMNNGADQRNRGVNATLENQE